jgi:hypothetical protein
MPVKAATLSRVVPLTPANLAGASPFSLPPSAIRAFASALIFGASASAIATATLI